MTARVSLILALLAGCGDDGPASGMDAGDGPESDASVEIDAGPPPLVTLRVSLAGDGTGAVRGAAGAIDCGDEGTACSAVLDEGTEVTLTATGTHLSHFAGWSGRGVDCGAEPTCTVTVTESGTITASFDLDQLSLMVTTAGDGDGTVSSEPAGVHCGETCAASYDAFTEVTLTATPHESSLFIGWEGACSGTEPTCTVTIDQAVSARAVFALREVTLTVARSGTGAGTVTSDPAGIACGETCSVTVTWGTALTLTASEDAATSTFGGFTGCDAATGATCSVTLTEDRAIDAAFPLRRHDLAITVEGSGAVTSSPAGIDCGATCSASYEHGTSVTLTASPDTATSSFADWGGACAGTTETTCTVDLVDARTVSARFTLLPRQLEVSRTGLGAGTITSTAAGIDCGTDCTETYPHGTTVTLTAAADAATSVFAGWSGSCSGTSATCTVAMTAARSVSARFDRAPRTITVVVGGAGSGRVSSSPGGIDCPGTCAAQFGHGTTVMLTASPSSSSSFAGWGGACAGTPFVVCTLTADGDQSVTASFD